MTTTATVIVTAAAAAIAVTDADAVVRKTPPTPTSTPLASHSTPRCPAPFGCGWRCLRTLRSIPVSPLPGLSCSNSFLHTRTGSREWCEKALVKQRYHGISTGPGTPQSIGRINRRLSTVLDHVGVGRLASCGLSIPAELQTALDSIHGTHEIRGGLVWAPVASRA